MTQLFAFAQSARGASVLTLASAVVAAGVTLRVDYDPDVDELNVRIRNLKSITRALTRVRAHA